MPEGHSIHRAAADQRRDLAGDRIAVASPQGRFVDAARIDGRVLIEVEAHGKHLFYRFGGAGRARTPIWVHVHLGLFGRFRRLTGVARAEPRGQVRMRLAGPRATFDLSGPTACDVVDPAGRAAVLGRLGPDPLRPEDDGGNSGLAVERLGASRRPIGAVLLDQAIVAGVGNVYRAEVLFLAGVDPRRPASSLSLEDRTQIWHLSRVLLAQGVRDRRIDTADFLTGHAPENRGDAPPRRRRRGERTLVYGQPTCRRCDGGVRTVDLGGRRLYWCPTCQA